MRANINCPSSSRMAIGTLIGEELMCCLPPRGTRVVPSSTCNLLGYEPNILALAVKVSQPIKSFFSDTVYTLIKFLDLVFINVSKSLMLCIDVMSYINVFDVPLTLSIELLIVW